MVTPDESSSLGAGESGESRYGPEGEPQCQWNGNSATIQMDFFTNASTKNVHAGRDTTVKQTSVDGLTAVQFDESSSVEFCQIIVDIGDTSTLSFGAGTKESGSTVAERCGIAMKLAELVIPRVNGR